MPSAAFELIADIGRELTRAGDALFEARVRFGELRKMLREAGAAATTSPPAPPAVAAPAAGEPLPPEVMAQLSAAGQAALRRGEDLPRVPPPPPGKFTLHGVPGFTARQLAEQAGCKLGTMKRRLQTMTPEEAVAAGDRMAVGYASAKAKANAATMQGPTHGLVYALDGKPISVRDLAALASCSVGAMQSRLSEAGMTPEAAVAAGAKMPRGAAAHKAPRRQSTKRAVHRDAGVAPPAPPTRAPSMFDVAAGALRMTEAERQAGRPMVPALDKRAEALNPHNVQPTVAPPIPDRFAVPADAVPNTFGRIGQYEDTGTALARSLKDRL